MYKNNALGEFWPKSKYQHVYDIKTFPIHLTAKHFRTMLK